MWLELREIFDKLSRDPNVRAVVISGAGPRAFTTGLDVKAASEGTLSGGDGADRDGARRAADLRRHIVEFQDCISAVERCEKPVICAIHGFAFGLGIDLSATTDVRICAADTKFSVKEVDIGLAADIGTLSRLPKVVGNYGWVKEVALTARVFGAEEALRVGYVNKVYQSKEEVVKAGVEMGELMASKSPVAVQGTKELLNWSRDHSIQDGMFGGSFSYCRVDISKWHCSILTLLLYCQVFATLVFGMVPLYSPTTLLQLLCLGYRSASRLLRSCDLALRFCLSSCYDRLNLYE